MLREMNSASVVQRVVAIFLAKSASMNMFSVSSVEGWRIIPLSSVKRRYLAMHFIPDSCKAVGLLLLLIEKTGTERKRDNHFLCETAYL
jgi:hypothetical protein